MWWLLLYFNWVPASMAFAVLAVRNRQLRGWALVLAGAALQVYAINLHLTDWQRLAGKPDQLYVWILPMTLALASVGPIAAGLWRVGIVKSKPHDP